MTEKDILLVKHSWTYIASQSESVADSFLKNLKRLNPEQRELYKIPEREGSHRLLFNTLHRLVVALPALTRSEGELKDLARQFSNFGLTRTDYDNATIAFLITMEKKLGKVFSQEIRESWVVLFATLARQIPKSFTRQLHSILI